jgi:uracil-DNA glycosylase
LTEFLSLLGFNVLPANETDRQLGVFATNAILCLKRGEADEMSASVKRRWFRACRGLLKWTIEESAAPAVITLGRPAFEAVVEAYRLNRQFRDAVQDRSPIRLDDHRVLFAVYHPAARPKDRNQSQMRDDWKPAPKREDRRGLMPLGPLAAHVFVCCDRQLHGIKLFVVQGSL